MPEQEPEVRAVEIDGEGEKPADDASGRCWLAFRFVDGLHHALASRPEERLV
jgi:hypothetical protein